MTLDIEAIEARWTPYIKKLEAGKRFGAKLETQDVSALLDEVKRWRRAAEALARDTMNGQPDRWPSMTALEVAEYAYDEDAGEG